MRQPSRTSMRRRLVRPRAGDPRLVRAPLTQLRATARALPRSTYPFLGGAALLLTMALAALVGLTSVPTMPVGAAPLWLAGAGDAQPPTQYPQIASFVDPKNDTAFSVRLVAAPGHPAGEFTFVFSTDNQVTGIAPLTKQADGSLTQDSVPNNQNCQVGFETEAAATAPNPPAKPQAAFTWRADQFVSLQVDFDATASQGSLLRYSWDFGDGSPAGDGPTPTHIYAQSGTYTVTLLVTDSANQQSTAQQPVTPTQIVIFISQTGPRIAGRPQNPDAPLSQRVAGTTTGAPAIGPSPIVIVHKGGPTPASYLVYFNLHAVIDRYGILAYSRFGTALITLPPGDIDQICRPTNPVFVEMNSGCTASGCPDPLAAVGGAVASFDQSITRSDYTTLYGQTSQVVKGQYTTAQFVAAMRDQEGRVGKITGISPINPSTVRVQIDIAGQAYFAVSQTVTISLNGQSSSRHVTSYYLLEGGHWLFWFSDR